MTSTSSPSRRGIVWFGLFLTLVVPALGTSRLAQRIPGLPPLLSPEVFWWSLAALVLVYILAVERRKLSSVGFRTPDWKTIAFGLGGGVATFAFAGTLVLLLFPIFHLRQDPAVLKKMLDTPYWYRVLLVTRAGVCEELLMRGYGIERLQELTGSKVVAGFLTLAVFTLGHWSYGTVAQLVVAAAAGFVLTILYLWRRDLYANMIAHWLTDAVSLLLR